MKHKKLFCMLLAAGMVFCAALAFTACNESDDNANGNNNTDDLPPTASLTYEKWDLEDAFIAKQFNIPAGTYYTVTGIEDKSVTSVVIPDTYWGLPVVAIWEHAFTDNNNVKTVVIPNSIKIIGRGAFYGCSGLTNITIPSSVISIWGSAFEDCSGLTSVTFEDGVTSIGYSAFDGCSGLTSITIPRSVTSIDEYAFSGCSWLTSITVAEGNMKYRSTENCLIEIASKTLIAGCQTSVIPSDGSVTSILGGAFSGCSGLTSLTIPRKVTSIGPNAFVGCSGLTSITIPRNVASLGRNLFHGCNSLTSLKVEIGNAFYYDADNCIIETASKTLVAGCQTSVIPTDGRVTSIGDSAFSGCSGLTSITIPNSVTSIGSSAFYGCSGLTDITIPNSVTKIESDAFNGCSGLTSIIIPDSVTEIGFRVFSGCSGVTSITIPNSVTLIRFRAISYCSALTKINYQGTMAEWNAIEKEYDWNGDTVDYTVYCTDGTLQKSEA